MKVLILNFNSVYFLQSLNFFENYKNRTKSLKIQIDEINLSN